MPDTISNLFPACRDWLESQPGMDVWEEGCEKLERRLAAWVEEYSRAVCQEPVDHETAAQDGYLERLWQSLSYHWQQAAKREADQGIAVERVVERLRRGRGWRRGGRLGGDPLRDVVLAVAMTLLDRKALEVFESDYREFCLALAAKTDTRLAHDFEPCWTEFLDHLAGYSGKPAKLEKFHGRCALRNWLRTVLYNFICRWSKRRTKERAEEHLDSVTASSDSPHAMDSSLREALAFFVAAFRVALEKLEPNDRLMVTLVHGEGIQQKAVAAVLNVDPGTVTRRLQKARAQLWIVFVAEVLEHIGHGAMDELLCDIRHDSRMFAQTAGIVLDVAEDLLRDYIQNDPSAFARTLADLPTISEGVMLNYIQKNPRTFAGIVIDVLKNHLDKAPKKKSLRKKNKKKRSAQDA